MVRGSSIAQKRGYSFKPSHEHHVLYLFISEAVMRQPPTKEGGFLWICYIVKFGRTVERWPIQLES